MLLDDSYSLTITVLPCGAGCVTAARGGAALGRLPDGSPPTPDRIGASWVISELSPMEWCEGAVVEPERYELVFRRQEAEPGQADDVVVVRRTSATGPGGHPVYCDDTGIVRAEISDRGEVRMLASGSHQVPRRPIAARLLA